MRRIYLPGVSCHVIRRGNNRGPIFSDDGDRELFLALVEWSSGGDDVDVNGFSLMDNHYHLIATPKTAAGLPVMMRNLGREYVKRYNRKHGRIGTLWTGRPKAIPITNERYWLTCLRYIEQNPVRAHIVASPGEYPWSSFGFHGLGRPHPWLVPHAVYLSLGATPEERQAVYRALGDATLSEAELVRQRHALTTKASSPFVSASHPIHIGNTPDVYP
jgi:putative transposase